MGRLTHSYRMQLQDELKNLERYYQRALRDVGRRAAFDKLKKAWSAEIGAMSYVKVPSVLDTLYLTAVVDNRKLINKLTDDLKMLWKEKERLTAELRELETRSKAHLR